VYTCFLKKVGMISQQVKNVNKLWEGKTGRTSFLLPRGLKASEGYYNHGGGRAAGGRRAGGVQIFGCAAFFQNFLEIFS
jgi:hypothetical protein